MNILITGGTGYLAGRIYKFFNNKNFNVKIASRKPKKLLGKLPAKKIINIDWTNIKNIEKICEGIDVIIHTVGLNAENSKKNPKKANLVKKSITYNILSAANKKKVKKFIYISTAHVYSNFLNSNITEKTITKNKHPYAIANLKGEKVVLSLNKKKQYTQPYILRLSNAFGSPLHKDSDCWKLFVNNICQQSIKSKKILINQNPLIKRDFITIYKFLEVIEKFFQLKKNHKQNIIYNVGSGNSYTLIQMAYIIRSRVFKLLHYYPEILIKNTKIFNKDNANFKYNISKLNKLNIKKNNYLNKEIDELILFCKKKL